MDGKLNLADAYTNYKDCFKMFGRLSRAVEGVDYTVSLLVLEGLYRLEFDHLKKKQFIIGGDSVERFKHILQLWRCESPMKDPFTAKCVPEILKSLSIFTLLDIPVFTGNFGQKAPMNNGRRDVEDICVDGRSQVIQCCHGNNRFDHNEEGGGANSAQRNVVGFNTGSCVDHKFCNHASFSMKGRWCKLLSTENYASNDTPNICLEDDRCVTDDNEANDNSCQPSGDARPTTTTLSQLGITGLCQGEVLYDVNTSKTYVILYATNNSNKKMDFHGLKKPVLAALRRRHNSDCRIEVVVFIPDSNLKGVGISHNNKQLKNAIDPGVNLTRNVMEGESGPGIPNNSLDDSSNDNSPVATFSNAMSEDESRMEITGAGGNCLDVTGSAMDLIGAFTSPEGLKLFFSRLTETLKQVDGTIGLLALEGLYRLDGAIGLINDPEMNLNRLPTTDFEREDCLIGGIRKLMYEWLRDFPTGSVTMIWWELRKVLVAYKTLRVPMFVDTLLNLKVCGLDGYSQDQLEDIDIGGETIIVHVTHVEEARNISRNSFKASDQRNAVKGTWFGIGRNAHSIYGSKCFETKPSLLGITGLHQGEIIYYHAERNVILYATDETGVDFKGLKKPTRAFVERESKTLSNDGNRSPRPYVTVSIFIPERFLPSVDNFHGVISEGADVKHVDLCVKEARGEKKFCNELVNRMKRVYHSSRFRQPSPGRHNHNPRSTGPPTSTPYGMNHPSFGDTFYGNTGRQFPGQSYFPPHNNYDPLHMSPYYPFPRGSYGYPNGNPGPRMDAYRYPNGNPGPRMDANGYPNGNPGPRMDAYGYPNGNPGPRMDAYGYPNGNPGPRMDAYRYPNGNPGPRMDAYRYPNGNPGPRMDAYGYPNGNPGPRMDAYGGPAIPPPAPHFGRQPHPHSPYHPNPYLHPPTGQDQRFGSPTFHQQYFN